MAGHEPWQWQQPGSTWKGAALYHITLTVTDRQPLLGLLAIPDQNPARAWVQRTPLGNALIDCLQSIQSHHSEVRVLHFCLMPDHLHVVLYVQRTMHIGIKALIRGFWQASKKLGRAALLQASFITPNAIREELKEESTRLQALAAGLRSTMGDDAYYHLSPVFQDMPFIRPMSRYSQLPTTLHYIDMNPQRLATKRLKPGLFRVQQQIKIGFHNFDGVGNTALLMEEHFTPVHVLRTMVDAAKHGNDTPLRNYMNQCVLQARKGTLMVSPFISPDEKRVMKVLLQEQHPFILLADNGFRDYYKPADPLFDACAAGRLLILSPWPYDSTRRRISRADCVALNTIAEDICLQLNQ